MDHQRLEDRQPRLLSSKTFALPSGTKPSKNLSSCEGKEKNYDYGPKIFLLLYPPYYQFPIKIYGINFPTYPIYLRKIRRVSRSGAPGKLERLNIENFK
jgi:hypothetical protein